MNGQTNTNQNKKKDANKSNNNKSEPAMTSLLQQLLKAKAKSENDLKLAKNALKFLELEWYELREIALKQTVTASTLKQEYIQENINHDDVTGINSKEILSLPLESFSKLPSDSFIGSEDETDEDN